MFRVHPILVSLLLLLSGSQARAGTVVLADPDCTEQDATETLSRLHGELLSVGLEVARATPPRDRDSAPGTLREWVTGLATTGEVDAVIAIRCDPVPVTIDIWIIEQSPRRIELSRVIGESNAPNAPERLAIRTIDLLRSSFLASDIFGAQTTTGKPNPSSTPEVDRAEKTPRHPSFGVELGASVLTGTDGIGPAFMPILAVDWTPHSWLSAHGTLSGFGSRPMVSAGAGNSRIAQHYGVLGASYRFRSEGDLSPFVALSAGFLRTTVQGEAKPPRQGHEDTQWSLLLDGSIGARLRLSRRYYLTLAAHVQLAEPYVAIHVLDEIVATSGRPNLALTGTVGAWL